MEPAEHRGRSRTQIQAMEVKVLTGTPIRLDRREFGCRPEFDVLATLGHSQCLQSGNETPKVFRVASQRFAMIGEGKGYQAPPGQPAMHTAQDQSVRQIAVRSRRR
jgi:hypothetical protein